MTLPVPMGSKDERTDREWWVRTLAGEAVTAADHLQLAQELMAFSERTRRANPEKGYACVRDDTERAKVHAILAVALALNQPVTDERA